MASSYAVNGYSTPPQRRIACSRHPLPPFNTSRTPFFFVGAGQSQLLIFIMVQPSSLLGGQRVHTRLDDCCMCGWCRHVCLDVRGCLIRRTAIEVTRGTTPPANAMPAPLSMEPAKPDRAASKACFPTAVTVPATTHNHHSITQPRAVAREWATSCV